MNNENQKLLIIATHAEEHPDKATLPFVVGNAALAMGNQVTIMLQTSAVFLATKGYAEHVQVAGSSYYFAHSYAGFSFQYNQIEPAASNW